MHEYKARGRVASHYDSAVQCSAVQCSAVQCRIALNDPTELFLARPSILARLCVITCCINSKPLSGTRDYLTPVPMIAAGSQILTIQTILSFLPGDKRGVMSVSTAFVKIAHLPSRTEGDWGPYCYCFGIFGRAGTGK
jgi:hypothetical protein